MPRGSRKENLAGNKPLDFEKYRGKYYLDIINKFHHHFKLLRISLSYLCLVFAINL